MTRTDYRIFALNTQNGNNRMFVVWVTEDELEAQLDALQKVGFNSISWLEL